MYFFHNYKPPEHFDNYLCNIASVHSKER